MTPTPKQLGDLNTVLACLAYGYEARAESERVRVYSIAPGKTPARIDLSLRYFEGEGWAVCCDLCDPETPEGCEMRPPSSWASACMRLVQTIMDDLIDDLLFANAVSAAFAAQPAGEA